LTRALAARSTSEPLLSAGTKGLGPNSARRPLCAHAHSLAANDLERSRSIRSLAGREATRMRPDRRRPVSCRSLSGHAPTAARRIHSPSGNAAPASAVPRARGLTSSRRAGPWPAATRAASSPPTIRQIRSGPFSHKLSGGDRRRSKLIPLPARNPTRGAEPSLRRWTVRIPAGAGRKWLRRPCPSARRPRSARAA
jgi:hypothetical protein